MTDKDHARHMQRIAAAAIAWDKDGSYAASVRLQPLRAAISAWRRQLYEEWKARTRRREKAHQLRRPEVYAAEAMPAAAADITPDYVNITFDQWWSKTITLSDKEIQLYEEWKARTRRREKAHA